MQQADVLDFNKVLANRIARTNAASVQQQLSSISDDRCLTIAKWVLENYKFGPGVMTRVWQGWTKTFLHDAIELTRPISFSLLNVSVPVLAHLVVKFGTDGLPKEATVVTLSSDAEVGHHGEPPDLSGFEAGTDTPSFLPFSAKVAANEDMLEYADWALSRHLDGDRRLTRWNVCERVDSVHLMCLMKSRTGDRYCFEVIFDDQGEPVATFKTVKPMKGKFACFDEDLNPASTDEFKAQNRPRFGL